MNSLVMQPVNVHDIGVFIAYLCHLYVLLTVFPTKHSCSIIFKPHQVIYDSGVPANSNVTCKDILSTVYYSYQQSIEFG